MEWSEGMQVLREWRVYGPALVLHEGRYFVFSRTALVSDGPTVEQALKNGGFLPRRPSSYKPFVAVGPNVVQENTAVCVARSKTMAVRIANALNEYIPGDRGF
jgi:hypothetical protein